MNPKSLAGRAVRRVNGGGIPLDLPMWGIRAIRRLSARIQAPGVYPLVIIRTEAGRWQLVIEPGGKVEDLGE